MTLVNAVLGGLVTGLLYPFRTLPPIVGLLVVSFLTAIAMLVVFRATSNQDRIAAVKRSIHAGLFEIRLFNDDLRQILRSQIDILRHNLTYLRLSLVPMVWMIVPLLLVIAQLQFHYGYRGLEPEHAVLVKVQFDADVPAPRNISLEAPEGMRVETQVAWIPTLREAAWRVVAEAPGDYDLSVHVDGRTFTKAVRTSDTVIPRSPVKLAPGFVNQLLYPAEAPLPADSGLASIELTYPEREISLLGWETHWLVAFFILSIVIAFALRNRFGVVL